MGDLGSSCSDSAPESSSKAASFVLPGGSGGCGSICEGTLVLGVLETLAGLAKDPLWFIRDLSSSDAEPSLGERVSRGV